MGGLQFHQLTYDMYLIFFFFKLWLPYKEKYNGHVIVDCKFFYFFFDKKNSRLQLVKNKVETS